MDVKILAPFKARRGDMNVAPSVGMRRQLLAPLILQCGQVATVSVLVDELWRTASPARCDDHDPIAAGPFLRG
jgi:hypothetical protein